MSAMQPASSSVFRQPAWRRYIARYLVGMGIWGALLVVTALADRFHHMPGKPWVYPLTAAPAVGVGVVVWSMLRYLEEEADEYQRLLNVRAFVAASGLFLVIATAWGLMQVFAGVPQASYFNVFPMFLACQGLATAWVRWRAR
jgi:hypothetical protein